MSWFRLDDQGAFHAKVLAAGNEAYGAWCRAGQWSSGHLTEGRIPRSTALTIAKQKVWQRLIDARLVESLGDDGYQIHDFLHWNPSAEESLEKRAKRAEAGRRGGLQKAAALRAASSNPGSRLRSSDVAIARDVAEQNAAPIPIPIPIPSRVSVIDRARAPAPGGSHEPPPWFLSAADTVEMGTGVSVDRSTAWLRYEGHRAQKKIEMSEPDARYWLTTVMVREATQDRERRRAADLEPARPAKVHGPLPTPEDTTPYAPPTPEEAAELERELANMLAPQAAPATTRVSPDGDLSPEELERLEAKRRAAVKTLRAAGDVDAEPASLPAHGAR